MTYRQICRIVGMPYPRRLAADMEPRRHGANLAFHRYRNAFRPILNRKSRLPITGSGFFVSSIYFSRINILIGVPVKSQFSRILFSRKRLYGSLIHCGKLQKNTKEGTLPAGSWVIYLILIYSVSYTHLTLPTKRIV